MQKKLLLAFTLIEMVVTMAIVIILIGVSISGLSQLKSNQTILEETTDIIINAINQVIYNSLNPAVMMSSNNEVCCVGDDGHCNLALRYTGKQMSLDGYYWANINKIPFNDKFRVKFQSTSSIHPMRIASIVYAQGVINRIYVHNSANKRYYLPIIDTVYEEENMTSITVNHEEDISPIIINIELIRNHSCAHVIKLWPNNVMQVDRSGASNCV